KFDGAWRGTFNAADHFKADNFVLCLARTTEFTDVWYTGKYQPNGTARKLKEVRYPTKPLNMPIDLSVKPGMACILLAHADSTFFGSAYNVMWDYACWPHIEGRAIAPTADIVIITLGPEPVKLVGVLGPNWFKLETADHYKGWVKVVDGKVQGYWHVMGYTADDIFDGIIIAG
ncbi:MAG: hypothetical protein Q8O09_03845, partial [Bacillota bacterium]|nr:hypothetical protein [Bacillota bacterium]